MGFVHHLPVTRAHDAFSKHAADAVSVKGSESLPSFYAPLESFHRRCHSNFAVQLQMLFDLKRHTTLRLLIELTKDPSPRVYVVSGKCKDLHILLFGALGVGSTSTAETFAAVNDRPLFSITWSGLCLTLEDAESAPEEIFFIAQTGIAYFFWINAKSAWLA